MDSLYLFGAIMIALGAILLIVGYPDGNTPVARERKADFVTFAE